MNALSNYEKAKLSADQIDKQILDVLKSGKSFIVEAGAGAGKTHSLEKVIDWIQSNRGKEYQLKKKQVACITYTNAAVDVINQRLASNSPINPSTIHSFAWDSMRRFQSAILRIVKNMHLISDGPENQNISKVDYTLGVRQVKDGCLYLYHDDVIAIFSEMLENKKFRQLLTDRYPVILIDEYQDSFKSIIDPFIKYFIEKETGPQFGFFGDSWQTIYSNNGACGTIESKKLQHISKNSNFRSQKCIVEVLNRIRPNLPQISALDENDGKVTVITTDEYNNDPHGRITKGYYKDELQDQLLKEVFKNVEETLFHNGWEPTETKILMITHKMLARQQGYENLLKILDKGFKNVDDPHLLFFMNRIEPIYDALEKNETKKLFEALGSSRQPINTLAQKRAWNKLKIELENARGEKIYDVIKCAYESHLIPMPPEIEETFKEYPNNKKENYANATVGELYNLAYSEVLKAIDFLEPDALFSTEHGVKGLEYDNVLFVIGRGWNSYRFDETLYKKENELNEKDAEVYIRNRNLFYVCCSRAKKNLALLITVPVNNKFQQYLERIFGETNIIPYKEFVMCK